jgi:hypothetical protein
MWNKSAPTINLNILSDLKPNDILYYYDGPCIFTATLGLSNYLFHKVDETDNEQLFLVAPTNKEIIVALKSGSLSVWGAINQDQLWIIELDTAFSIKRTWEVNSNELPIEFLPKAGLGLKPQTHSLADAIEQVDSFFSMKFTGATLKRGIMPLSTLKTLVDGVSDSLRKIFPAPIVAQKSLNRYFDFNVLQPKFASLVIAVERPYVDLDSLRKDIRDKIAPNEFEKIFEANRDSFFTNVSTVLTEARKGEIKRGFALEHFVTLEQISAVVPTEARDIEAVEFRSGAAQSAKSIKINDEIGTRIKGAHRLAELSNRGVRGTIIEINSASASFVIATASDARQITCVLSPNVFRESHLAMGQDVRVHGKYTKRSRRDRIDVEGYPEIFKSR